VGSHFINPTVDSDSAYQLLNPRKFFSFKRKPRCRLEAICLPCRKVIRVGSCGDPDLEILVNGYGHSAQLIRSIEQSPDGGAFSAEFDYPLSDETTLQLAEKMILSWTLNRVIRVLNESSDYQLGDIIQYPFWVGYSENPNQQVSFRIFDAVTGRIAGHDVRDGFLIALKTKNLPSH
jgi:hypothetical protein